MLTDKDQSNRIQISYIRKYVTEIINRIILVLIIVILGKDYALYTTTLTLTSSASRYS
jgi:hypothetical protein